MYAAFVFLWFRGNFRAFRDLNVSPLIPLVPLLAIIAYQGLAKWRRRRISPGPRFRSALVPVATLILIALAVRLPCLLYSSGIIHSDDAISALMGKHIAEGRVPPVTYYGEFHDGSLANHFYALVFKLFGYSVLGFEVSNLLFLLGFVVIQFLLLRDIFSTGFAWAVSLFYALPNGNTVLISFDDVSSILFLGILLIFVSYGIAFKQRTAWVPAAGFLMGLCFWTQPMTVYFILVSGLMMILAARLPLRKYGTLALYALLGFLPQILLEFLFKFHLVKFLLSGEKNIGWAKVQGTGLAFLPLVSCRKGPANLVLLGLIGAGLVVLVARGLRDKRFQPPHLYVLFFAVFLPIFFFSGFSNDNITRYVDPLHFCLPVLMFSGLLVLGRHLQTVLTAILVLAISLLFSVKVNYRYWLGLKEAHAVHTQAIAAMEQTGQKYWRGHYWTAYMLTALAGEKVIVDATNANRYFPYRLLYDNENTRDNFVFLNRDDERYQERALVQRLNALGLDYQKKDLREGWLVYGIPGPIFPESLWQTVPLPLPAVEGAAEGEGGGSLRLQFRPGAPMKDPGFRVEAEIPGYSTASAEWPPGRPDIQVDLPCPGQASFVVRYRLDYQGTAIPSTTREVVYRPGEEGCGTAPEPVVLLSGFGPALKFASSDMRPCEKEAKFRLTGLKGIPAKVRCQFFMPLNFTHLNWYGSYSQQVDVVAQGMVLASAKLPFGESVVEFDPRRVPAASAETVFALRFKYQLPFKSTPFRKVSALLEKISVN